VPLSLIGVAAACVAVTVAVSVADPFFGVMEYDDLREGQLEAFGATVLTVTAAVLLGRFRRVGARHDLLLAAGLLVLAAENLFGAIATPVVDSLAASRSATWTAAGAEMLGAAVLVAAALLPDRTVVRRGRAGLAVLAVTGTALLTIAVVGVALEASLPDAFAVIPATIEELRSFTEHRALRAVELGVAGAWATVAVSCAHRAGRDEDRLLRAVSLGAVVSAAVGAEPRLVPVTVHRAALQRRPALRRRRRHRAERCHP
jgi:hypothetical protein